MNPYIQYMYSYPHKTAYRSLSGVSLKDYAPLLRGSGHGLYLHIPFCQAKCGYCNLFSVTGQKEEKIERYLDTVERQSQQYQSLLAPYQTEFSELVIGGGTPLLLSEWQLLRMFALIEKYFTFQKGRELIIETAPNQTDTKRLSILKQAKVTRVSMG
ncbi:MAG: radical SAM protein, partial [Lachnospiraceae bacterium]|nr:radical SAM protein [Lachnospiraceae bacterium]